jgi:DNA-binding transcriptional LysR family regulator
MDIKQLKAFVAIADTETFTAGARRMNITQAAISMQIRHLEQELGIPLFTRTPRKVILTEAGEALLIRARRILREHDAALAETAEIAGAEHGRLRIGSASATFSSNELPEILKVLKSTFPKSEISVFSGTSERLIEKITHGELDVAFVSLPVSNTNIQTELMFSDEVAVIVHTSHPKAGEKVISAAALAKENLILGEKGGNTRRMIDEFFSDLGLRPHIVMELSRQSAINRMVENRMGVGIAGLRAVKQQVDEKALAALRIEGAELHWDLGIARLRGGYLSPIARDFIEVCKKTFETKQ